MQVAVVREEHLEIVAAAYLIHLVKLILVLLVHLVIDWLEAPVIVEVVEEWILFELGARNLFLIED